MLLLKEEGEKKGICFCVFLEDCRSVMDITQCCDVCLHLHLPETIDLR